MTHSHDLAIVCPCQHPQTIWQIFFLYRKRMIPCHTDRRIDSRKYAASIMLNQCIGEALGGTVSYAKALFHGKQSLIEHDGSSVFTVLEKARSAPGPSQ